MREIRFRAWDKQNKCWSIGPLYIDDEGRLFEIYERSFAFETYMHNENVSADHDVVWYTGLKDKNGVEIYEGDILKFHRAGFPIEPMYHVEFHNGAFNLTSHTEGYSDSCTCEMVMDYGEVIGNIYENPELLSRGESDAK